jgi:hypothetical protein
VQNIFFIFQIILKHDNFQPWHTLVVPNQICKMMIKWWLLINHTLGQNVLKHLRRTTILGKGRQSSEQFWNYLVLKDDTVQSINLTCKNMNSIFMLNEKIPIVPKAI